MKGRILITLLNAKFGNDFEWCPRSTYGAPELRAAGMIRVLDGPRTAANFAFASNSRIFALLEDS